MPEGKALYSAIRSRRFYIFSSISRNDSTLALQSPLQSQPGNIFPKDPANLYGMFAIRYPDDWHHVHASSESCSNIGIQAIRNSTSIIELFITLQHLQVIMDCSPLRGTELLNFGRNICSNVQLLLWKSVG